MAIGRHLKYPETPKCVTPQKFFPRPLSTRITILQSTFGPRERDINTPRKAVAFHFVSLRCKWGDHDMAHLLIWHG